MLLSSVTALQCSFNSMIFFCPGLYDRDYFLFFCVEFFGIKNLDIYCRGFGANGP